MPVVFYKPLSADTSICVWKIDETAEELLSMTEADAMKRIAGYKKMASE